MKKRIYRLWKLIFAAILCITMEIGGMPVFAADPILQTDQPVSDLTIHVLQRIDKKELETDGSGLPGQTIPGYGTDTFPLEKAVVTIQRVTYEDQDIGHYTVTGDPITQMTDEDGLAVFQNVPNGRYAVKYTNLPQNVKTQIKDHFVDLPSRNADGTGWNYDVHVYPKNEAVYGSVILTKRVGDDHTTPLAGAKFRLYMRNPQGKYENEYMDAAGRKTEFVTNRAGQIAVSGLPDGSYAFIETAVPAGYAIDPTPIPFTVTASGSVKLADGAYLPDKGTVYTVSHENYRIPEIHKGVKSVKNQHSGYAGDAVSTFVVSPTVPKDIARYTKLIVTDDVNGQDDRLRFAGLDTLNVVVSDVSLDSTVFDQADLSAYTLLKKDRDYQAAYDADSETWTVTFINADAKFLNGRDCLANKYVYIVFGCKFDTEQYRMESILGEDISNQAELIYNNGFMQEDGVLQSEIPEIHTGGITLYKYTGSLSKPLGGAEFKLSASYEDALAGRYLKNNSGADICAVSDENGIIRFEGIAYGEDGVDHLTAETAYWLVETEAPPGYLLIGQPISITIDQKSHLYDTLPALQIENIPVSPLPRTGGAGLLPFYISGTVCAMIAAGLGLYLFLLKRKGK